MGRHGCHFLDKNPQKLWDAHKVQAIAEGRGSETYAWDHFENWFTASFALSDVVKSAFTKLVAPSQTGSVAEHKAEFDVWAAQANVPSYVYVGKGLEATI